MFTASAFRHHGLFALLVVLSFLLTGCDNKKVTQENYDKIKNDMTLQEVQEILGKGEEVGGDAAGVGAQAGVDVNGGFEGPSFTTYSWESGKKSITVTIRKGKVIGKTSSGL